MNQRKCTHCTLHLAEKQTKYQSMSYTELRRSINYAEQCHIVNNRNPYAQNQQNFGPYKKNESHLPLLDNRNIDEDNGPVVIENKHEEYKATNLIVNYLPHSMTLDQFKSIFESFGEFQSCKLIYDKNTGRGLGYGFINYVNPESAEKAIEAVNGLLIQNKVLKVSHARPSSEAIKGANLYVCGLPKTITNEEFEKLFRPYGRIITSRLLYDKAAIKQYIKGDTKLSGICIGIGFIRFDKRTDAEQARNQLNRSIPWGFSAPITVKFTSTNRCIPAKNYVPRNLFSHVVSPHNLSPKRNLLHHPMFANTFKRNGWCLFVYNLPMQSQECMLWELFSPFGAVQQVKIIRDYVTNKCKGYAFVTMTNYSEALLAINSLHGYVLNNNYALQVSFKTESKCVRNCLK